MRIESNTGSTELSGFEVFYMFTDPTGNVTESYYVKLPDTFTISAGGSRIAHFDNTGAADHSRSTSSASMPRRSTHSM